MLKKKDWKELMQEFIDKVNKREQMIQSKIDDLKKQERTIQAQIKNNSGHMIELEMNEDMSSAEKIKKENKQLRLQIEEIQDSIAGYENQLGTSRDLYAKDLDKIRTAVKKAEEERVQRGKDLFAEMDEVDEKIEALKKEREQLSNDYHFNNARKERHSLEQYIEYLDSRAGTIEYADREQFILRWLSGNTDEIDNFFKKRVNSDQPHVTHINYLR